MCFFVAQQPLLGQGILIVEASRTQSDTPHSVELFWTSDQPVAELYLKTHNTHEKKVIHVPGGFRIRNTSKDRQQTHALVQSS